MKKIRAHDFAVVLITAPSVRLSRGIARALVEEKWAACVNIAPGISSVYRWKGRIESTAETLLFVKTRRSKLPGLVKRVQTLHTHSVPEIIALPLIDGNSNYLHWLDESL